MDLSELVDKYYFHDSSIEETHYNKDARELVLEIEFCTWMQEWYSEKSDDEIEMLTLVFKNVSEIDLSDFKPSNYDRIIDVDLLKAEDGTEGIKIYIETEEDYPVVIIFAETVTVKRRKSKSTEGYF